MLELMIQGRGGQGAQTAGSLLAMAFYAEGREVQAFATYGGARRGTPVSSYIRIDDKPIHRRCDVENPDAILCFDPHLLDHRLLRGATESTPVVVNSSQPASRFRTLGDYNIYTIDAFRIARDNGLGRFINSALLGAFTAILDAPDIDTVCKTIRDSAPVKKEENARACMEGYRQMQNIRNPDKNGLAV